MPRLSVPARRFIEEYSREHQTYELAADEARRIVAEIVAGANAPVHVVMARAKGVVSLRAKLRAKGYPRPQSQVTDIIGLRVIVLFARDVDRVSAVLRAQLDVSERKCRDARIELGENRFGYRSLHLIARAPSNVARSERAPNLRRRWFEVQVRSVLDHAWSEIEHDVVYKSGIEFPLAVQRQFKAVAGALEVLEDAFARLADERDALVDDYRSKFTAGRELEVQFDSARLVAFLEWARPNAVGWRAEQRQGRPSQIGSPAHAVEALLACGLSTPAKLKNELKSARFRRKCERFAALEGLAVSEVSHLACVVLAVACVDSRRLATQFPEMVFAPSIGAVLALGR